MPYKEVYNVSNESSDFFLLFIIASILAIGWVGFASYKKNDSISLINRIAIGLIACLIFAVSSISFLAEINGRNKHIYWLASGKYEVAEGYVENFNPAPYQGHKKESFTINGHVFKYSDYERTAAFNQTRSHGGPIYQGRWIKVYYHDGLILKIEVKD